MACFEIVPTPFPYFFSCKKLQIDIINCFLFSCFFYVEFILHKFFDFPKFFWSGPVHLNILSKPCDIIHVLDFSEPTLDWCNFPIWVLINPFHYTLHLFQRQIVLNLRTLSEFWITAVKWKLHQHSVLSLQSEIRSIFGWWVHSIQTFVCVYDTKECYLKSTYDWHRRILIAKEWMIGAVPILFLIFSIAEFCSPKVINDLLLFPNIPTLITI